MFCTNFYTLYLVNGSYRIIRRWILFVFVDYYSIKYSHFGTFNSARQCDTSPIEPAGHVSPKTNSYRKSDAQSPHSKSIELTGINAVAMNHIAFEHPLTTSTGHSAPMIRNLFAESIVHRARRRAVHNVFA